MQPCRRTTLPSVSSSALLLFAQGAATCLSSATGTSSRAAAPTAAPATSPASPAPRARTPATPSARPILHPASATRSATTPRHPAVLRKPAGSRWAKPLPDDSPRWATFSHRCAAPQFTAVPVADMRGSMEQDAYFRVQKTAANGTVVESKYYENYACAQQESPSHSLRSPPGHLNRLKKLVVCRHGGGLPGPGSGTRERRAAQLDHRGRVLRKRPGAGPSSPLNPSPLCSHPLAQSALLGFAAGTHSHWLTDWG